ncbi:hypothetical protein OK351_06440 [Glutamicibacter sp. MNS18]|uniref:hypothetical protein n=1 Tax=Glutamicibacter sp. MNS18 TaxID=2989817 RepID=UPI002236673D|nr:hypothetical protein [Glutamicibacter sp. MNS18]MCW4465139.1 hypothetical protein [Glutamicibacter sp. MNS18]
MYVRFQSPVPNKRGLHIGVFGLANGLAHSGSLSKEEWTLWRRHNDWFNDAYPDPAQTSPQVYDTGLNPVTSAWFKESATHLIERVVPYLGLLRAHGVGCVRVESADPGQVIYEDGVQVVVIPYSESM